MQIPDAAQWSSSFDIDRATQAWLHTLSAAQRAQSNAYVDGGYWLLLWNLLWGLGIAALLLSGQRSARLRDWAGRITALRGLQTLLYGAVYLLLTWLLSLPLTIYQDFFREHQYGLATQSFMPWFGEQCISLALLIVLGAPFIALCLYPGTAALGRAAGHQGPRRCRRPAARGSAALGAGPAGDSDPQFDQPFGGKRSGHIRSECRARTAGVRLGGDPAGELSQARPRSAGGDPDVRPPQRAHARTHGDALAEGKPAAIMGRRRLRVPWWRLHS
jgi:CAAX prenyl protease N-terminal, five membrane helices